MTHYQPYDPAVSHAPTTYGPMFGCTDPCCIGATPGGNHTITWANEKGVAEYNQAQTLKLHQRAALGSDHDAYARGIYETHAFNDHVYETED